MSEIIWLLDCCIFADHGFSVHSAIQVARYIAPLHHRVFVIRSAFLGFMGSGVDWKPLGCEDEIVVAKQIESEINIKV